MNNQQTITLDELKVLCELYDAAEGMNKENRFEGECVYLFIKKLLEKEEEPAPRKFVGPHRDLDLKDLW